MTYTNISERNILTLIAIACLFAVSAFAFAGVARADDFNYSEPYAGYSEPYANYSETYASNYSQPYGNYSEPYANYSEPYANYSEPYASNYSEPYAPNYSEPYAPNYSEPYASTPSTGTYYPYGGTYYPYGGTYSDYGGYGYGATGYASLGIGLGFGYNSYPYYYPSSVYYPTSTYYPTTSYYPTSTYYPTTSYYPTSTFVPTPTFVATTPNNTYSPTTVNAPTTTYAPTSVYSPTSTYAPTNTSTYAPTDTSIYSPTNTSTYAPTSVYAPSDSHNVVGPTTVTTDSHNSTTVSVVSNTTQAAPQYPVQYIYGGGSYFGGGSYVAPSYFTPTYYNTPTYFPYVQAPSCVITASASPAYLNYGNRAVVLTWTSTNANSGYITPLVGTVAPAGSTTVFPNSNTLYTLTVSGNGGTSSCQTYAGAVNPVVATATVAPYVALTQIPYTGFDFGTFGNVMYWTLLALFAVAVSYLVLYFRGGAFALVASMIGRGTKTPTVVAHVAKSASASASSYGETKKESVVAAVQETKPAPATSFRGPSTGESADFVARPESANFVAWPTATTGGTKDSMLSIGATESGIGPRIVVLRS